MVKTIKPEPPFSSPLFLCGYHKELGSGDENGSAPKKVSDYKEIAFTIPVAFRGLFVKAC